MFAYEHVCGDEVESVWFSLAPFRYDFNPAHQMLLALCDSLAPSKGPKATELWRLCNLREEQLIAGGLGFIYTEMHCRSHATLCQSEFSVALQMCVRDSFLYLSTSLSYRATERLPNLAHRALHFFPLLFELPSWLRENCVFVFLFFCAVFVRFLVSWVHYLRPHWGFGCSRWPHLSAMLFCGTRKCCTNQVTVCLHKKGMSLWFYFPETIMTTLWSTSNALSLHSWFIWFAFETSFWSLCECGLAHCGAQLRKPECSCEPSWRKLHENRIKLDCTESVFLVEMLWERHSTSSSFPVVFTVYTNA